jgi:uncharacterized Rmd1/YagE family protein
MDSTETLQSKRPLLNKERNDKPERAPDRGTADRTARNTRHERSGSGSDRERRSRGASPAVNIHKVAGYGAIIDSGDADLVDPVSPSTENFIMKKDRDDDNKAVVHSDNKLSPDEFDERSNINEIANKITRTGRQRKKLAARTKGGEFQAKRKKKRIYFCCISSEIDLERLQDAILAKPLESNTKQYELKMYEDVLHVFISEKDTTMPADFQKQGSFESLPSPSHQSSLTSNNYIFRAPSGDNVDMNSNSAPKSQSASKLWTGAARELFIFEFGVAVFWGYSRGEEEEMISLIRQYVEQGMLTPEEVASGQDDMAFIIASDIDQMEISNDVMTLPDDFGAKYRLSASFAIAQSAVLNVFEARIEDRVKEYKYIPESLAHSGKLTLTPKTLNRMVGDVYKIRHDVNLHTEILDTPDFFWKQERQCDDIYKLISRYLEMSERTHVLNKRLDMLRELLSVLQQQQENSSAMKLEWIVIWLIVISVFVESAAIAVEIFKT